MLVAIFFVVLAVAVVAMYVHDVQEPDRSKHFFRPWF